MDAVHRGKAYRFSYLVDRPELVDACIQLLNSEWPRSETVRQASMKRCLQRDPPIGFVMTVDDEESNESVVGFAKICRMPMEEDACWVESVILASHLRGQGVGRVLMDFIHTLAAKHDFKIMYLSTTDKVAFYEKCGFEECPPVVYAGSASKLLQNTGFGRAITRTVVKKESNPVSMPPPASVAPTGVPIFPPVPFLLPKKTIIAQKTFMKKTVTAVP